MTNEIPTRRLIGRVRASVDNYYYSKSEIIARLVSELETLKTIRSKQRNIFWRFYYTMICQTYDFVDITGTEYEALLEFSNTVVPEVLRPDVTYQLTFEKYQELILKAEQCKKTN